MSATHPPTQLHQVEWPDADVLDGQDPRGPGAMVKRKAGLAVAGFVILMFALGALALSPAEWWSPSSLRAESFEISEASMRLAMVRERQRVDGFVQRTGRLPVTLAEAGGYLEGVRYTALSDGTYVLDADFGLSHLRLLSTGSVEAFLGNSLQVILNRPAP